MMKLIDLLIFYIANVGLAYIITQSVLLQEPRSAISRWLLREEKETTSFVYKFISNKLDYLITCIVCASVWTSCFLFLFANKFSLIQIGSNGYDLLLIALMSPIITLIFNNFMYSEIEEEEEWQNYYKYIYL